MDDYTTFRTCLETRGMHHVNYYEPYMVFPNTSEFNSKLTALPLLQRGALDASRYFSRYCYQINPNLGTIQTTQVKTYGEHYEMPYTKSYNNLTASFYLDNDGIMYQIFSVWMECIFNTKTRTIGYLEDYAGTLSLTLRRPSRPEDLPSSSLTPQLTNTETVIVYESIYPKEISPLPLSGMVGQTPTQFDVTFAYRRAYVKGIGDNAPSDLTWTFV